MLILFYEKQIHVHKTGHFEVKDESLFKLFFICRKKNESDIFDKKKSERWLKLEQGMEFIKIVFKNFISWLKIITDALMIY